MERFIEIFQKNLDEKNKEKIIQIVRCENNDMYYNMYLTNNGRIFKDGSEFPFALREVTPRLTK